MLSAERQEIKCAFCSSHGVMLCKWPCDVFVHVAYSELNPGDRVRRAFQGANDSRPPAKVISIEAEGFVGDTDPWALRISLKTGTDRVKEIRVNPRSPVRVARLGKCNQPCCSLHRREVGEETAYCQDHWRGWESA